MTGGKRPGFSLMEMLIVVALFSTLALILSQTFVSFNRLHRKVSNAAVLGQDMRFAMELLVRTARGNQIDYSLQPWPDRVPLIVLQKPGGGTLAIGTRPGGAEGDCKDASVTQCLALSVDDGTTWQPLTATRVNVDSFDVYVRPANSPFVPVGGAYDSNLQPFVTFNLALTYKADNPKDNVSLRTQTTVSSRVYQR